MCYFSYFVSHTRQQAIYVHFEKILKKQLSYPTISYVYNVKCPKFAMNGIILRGYEFIAVRKKIILHNLLSAALSIVAAIVNNCLLSVDIPISWPIIYGWLVTGWCTTLEKDSEILLQLLYFICKKLSSLDVITQLSTLYQFIFNILNLWNNLTVNDLLLSSFWIKEKTLLPKFQYNHHGLFTLAQNPVLSPTTMKLAKMLHVWISRKISLNWQSEGLKMKP